MEGHHHNHSFDSSKNFTNHAFIAGIVLNLLFVFIEFGFGFYLSSLGLISDAFHNLSDVVSLFLSLIAFQLSKILPNYRFTYGYRKTTILVSLINGIILMIAIGGIAIESVSRMNRKQALNGEYIAYVATAGILINGLTAFFFFKEKDNDLNIKGAFLHLVLDTLVSVGVLVSGIIIQFTSWYWVDSIVSLAIIIVIFGSAWSLLKDSLVLSLDGVPKDIDLNLVKNEILKNKEVKDIHHIHVWGISTSLNAMTAHLVIAKKTNFKLHANLKSKIKHSMEHLKIQHVTLELESEDEFCNRDNC
ncbi:MAG: cation diffusion facilitator family transporter [Leptospiraceae bacterium]|nr:cation transporter [Leptospiraceae bacterium]MCK6381960.1 cation diffusion facilitator family transporter [Leptospiraceae bacterium]NUM40298.1 cation transporter [Leptospiraceae bacterium]